MFAFALWDDRQRTAFIARDRFGKKPLFYYAAAGRLVFASEMKALLEHPAVPRKVDLRALDDYLAHSYVPSDRCILAGVSKLPPGHWMRWRDGSLEVRPYWQVDFRPGPPLSEEEWAERVEDALRRSVRLRLRADVPLGIFLSGGVDSSAVAAIASQELGSAVNTFSIGFGHADFDELRYARLVAERYHTNHHELIVEDRDLSLVADVAYHLDEPFGDPSALPTFMVCREARKHVTVCLSGDGGDEVFAGYGRYRQALRYAHLDRAPAGVRRWISKRLQTVMPAEMWGRGFVERFGLSGVARYFAQLSEFTADERRALLAGRGSDEVTEGPRRFEATLDQPAPDLVARLQLIDQQNYLPDDILVKVDRTSMQTSLEVRAPFLDHLLVELANAAPTRLKLRGGRGKYLLRKILEPHLPASILNRRKMGFGVPIKALVSRLDAAVRARPASLRRQPRAGLPVARRGRAHDRAARPRHARPQPADLAAPDARTLVQALLLVRPPDLVGRTPGFATPTWRVRSFSSVAECASAQPPAYSPRRRRASATVREPASAIPR